MQVTIARPAVAMRPAGLGGRRAASTMRTGPGGAGLLEPELDDAIDALDLAAGEISDAGRAALRASPVGIMLDMLS